MAESSRVATKWSIRELHALIAAKKWQQDQAILDSSRERIRTAETKWKEVEGLCKDNGVIRPWKKCKKRWEKLFTDFKKVNDYLKQVPSGHPGYFELTRREKKDRGLPPKFVEELFQSMITLVPRNRAVEPHPDQFVDSGIEDDVRALQRSPPVSNPDVTDKAEDNDTEHTTGASPHANATNSDGVPHHVPPASPTHANASEGQRQESKPVHAPGDSGSAERSTRGWRRTRAERTIGELNKVTQSFVTAIADNRLARREEHTEMLVVQREAQQLARDIGRDVANALGFIGDSIRYLADGVQDRDTSR